MNSIKLSHLKIGQRAAILGIRGSAAEKQRLAGMGLNIGFELEMMEAPRGSGGAMLVGIGGTRLVLADDVAAAILVRAR